MIEENQNIMEKMKNINNNSKLTKAFKGIPGSTLKIIAIVSMFIDHVGAGILERYLDNFSDSDTLTGELLWRYNIIKLIDGIFRAIGRLAFPIFIFLLIEGFYHTRSIARYLRNLLIFALVSEFPFDSAFNSDFALEFGYQNVYFTLFIGLVVVWISSGIKKREFTKMSTGFAVALDIFATAASIFILLQRHGLVSIILGDIMERFSVTSFVIYCLVASISIVAAAIIALVLKKRGECFFKRKALIMLTLSVGMLLAVFLRTDYSAYGVLAVLIMYIFSQNKEKASTLSIVSLAVYNPIEAVALFDLDLIRKYNGERGLKLKYIFYAFYPAHLMLIAVVGHILDYYL